MILFWPLLRILTPIRLGLCCLLVVPSCLFYFDMIRCLLAKSRIAVCGSSGVLFSLCWVSHNVVLGLCSENLILFVREINCIRFICVTLIACIVIFLD